MSRVDDWKARATIRGQEDGSVPVAADPYLDVEHNMIVRAGAGSGKTTALVERIVAHLRLGEDPSTIVAITFTRKAAAELRGRIHEEVHTAVNRAEGGEEREVLIRARGRLDEMHIGTIHGFCAQLVRQYADVAGVPPDFRQVEEEEEADMRSRFWSAFLQEQDENEDLVSLREAGVSRASLVDLFGRLAENADMEAVRGELLELEFGPAVEAARKTMDELEPLGCAGDQGDAVQNLLRKARFMEQSLPEMSTAQTAVWLRLFADMVDLKKGRLAMTMNRWDRPQKFMKAVRDGLEDDEAPWRVLGRIQEQIIPRLAAWDALVHSRATALVEQAVSDYAAHRKAEGRLTISDPIHILNDLLRRSPDVRKEVQVSLRRILVDEFQDTDPVQASVLFHLVAAEVDDEDWSRNRLLPGRLLLVGDDKQSIYRFRRADFEVFARSEAAIVSEGGRSLVLGTNFRSSESICSWINGAIEPLFRPARDEERMEQAPWEPLRPFRSGAEASRSNTGANTRENTGAKTESGPGAAVQALVLDPKLSAEDGVVAEARTIARAIWERLDSGRYASPADFMILFRRNTYVSRYVAELTAAGLPVRVTGGKAAGGSDVLPAVCSVLEALVREGDEAAGVAALRTPFFAVSDADLYAWRTEDGRFDGFAEHVADADSADADSADADSTNVEGPDNIATSAVHNPVVYARAVLARICRRFKTLPPCEALRVTADEEGWWDVLAARQTAAVDTGILQKILALFASAEDRGLDWMEATEELLRYRNGDVPMKLHAANGEEGVQIMTVHQAKGLQAQCVFLADPGRAQSSGRVPHTHSFTRDGRAFIALALRKFSGFSPQVTFTPPAWPEAVRAEEAFSRAEHVRLLYVACTRAARELVVAYRGEGPSGYWDDLAPRLRDVPVLAQLDHVPERAFRDEDSPGQEAPGTPARDRMQERMQEAIRAGSRPTHILLRPSDKEDTEDVVTGGSPGLAHDAAGGSGAGPLPPISIGMEGKDFGQAVHLGLERLVTDATSGRTPEPRQAAVACLHAVLDSEPVEASIDAVFDALSGFMQGAVWSKVRAADEVLAEVSFTTSLPGSPARIVSGTVDLALRRGDTWLIVDYKTDRTSRPGLLALYRSQLGLYAACWRQMFPGRSVQTAIWSTASHVLLEVATTESDQL